MNDIDRPAAVDDEIGKKNDSAKGIIVNNIYKIAKPVIHGCFP